MTQFPPIDPSSGGSIPTPPQAGWHPDPTGRHQHRYWDGVQWTDHVADNGLETVDPFSGAPPGAPAGMPSPGYGAPYPPTASQPQPGPQGPGRPPPSGPSPALLVGMGVVLLALVIAVVVVLTRDDGDDDETTTDTTTSTEDTTDTTGSTEDTSQSGLVDALATGVLQSSNGALTQEDATCVAEQMLEVLGAERIMEISQDPSADAFAALTTEEQVAVTEGMLECVDAETLADIGASNDN